MTARRSIWLGIVASTIAYAFVAWRVVGEPPFALGRQLLQPFMYVVYAVALATYATAFLFSGVLARRGTPAQTVLIVKLAMLEAVCIFGLVAAFVAHDWRLYVPTWALASVGLLRSFPIDAADRR
jgi:F0F1-type ATP synthase membrane subunit c/vacuolar-type H+-ATPase subunit K